MIPNPTVSEDQYRTPSKEHYGNEVYLTGQNPPSKCCQPLDFWYTFLIGLIFEYCKYRVCRVKSRKVTKG